MVMRLCKSLCSWLKSISKFHRRLRWLFRFPVVDNSSCRKRGTWLRKIDKRLIDNRYFEDELFDNPFAMAVTVKMTMPGTITFEESGRRYIVSRNEKEKQQWLASQDEFKELSRAEAGAVASLIIDALGSEGLDKLMMSSDGDITVTNDGATILKNMDIDEFRKLIYQYVKSRNEVFGQTVISFISVMLMVHKTKLYTGNHPIRIVDVFELAIRD